MKIHKSVLQKILFFAIIVTLIFAGFSISACGGYNEGGTEDDGGDGDGDGGDGDGDGDGGDGGDGDGGNGDGTFALDYFREQDIRLGWNLGNTLDANTNGVINANSETSWGNPAAAKALFDAVKAQGIDIVRIPVTWGNGTNNIGPAPTYTIDSTRLNRVHAVVTMARDAGLKVIINTHHDDTFYGWINLHKALNSDQEKTEIDNKLREVWRQIANKFKDYGQWLIFESMNEVIDRGPTADGNDDDWGWDGFRDNPKKYIDVINDWNQIFTDVVRSTGGNNATRFLMYPSYASNPYFTLPDGRTNQEQSWTGSPVGVHFKLPTDSAGTGRQIITYHYYNPFNFAHDATVTNWNTGGNASFEQQVVDLFTRTKTHFIDKGIPVIIGEMGPRWQTSAEGQTNRLAYINYVWGKAREYGLVPVYWDDGGNFRMMNRTTNQPRDAHATASFAAMRTAVGR